MKLPGVRTILRRLVFMVFAIYAMLFFCQRYLIFPAYMANTLNGVLKTPADYGLNDFAEIPLTASDAVHILGWSHEPAAGMPVILYFHGNAMHIAAHAQRYREFVKAGYGVFAMEYRGYGRSEGSPSEEGLYKDARAAMEWLHSHNPNQRIILYGESLGSGVASEMAKEYTVAGLVIQSGYSSIADVAGETYWFLPGIHALVRDEFNSLGRMKDIHCPVLILHGTADNVIPFAHGELLAANANEPKRFVSVAGASHMNIPDATIIKAMEEFFPPSTFH